MPCVTGAEAKEALHCSNASQRLRFSSETRRRRGENGIEVTQMCIWHFSSASLICLASRCHLGVWSTKGKERKAPRSAKTCCSSLKSSKGQMGTWRRGQTGTSWCYGRTDPVCMETACVPSGHLRMLSHGSSDGPDAVLKCLSLHHPA